MYVVAVVAMLAMLIPATAVPVSAAPGDTITPAVSHNVVGATERFTVNAVTSNFTVQDVFPGTGAIITAQQTGTNPSWVEVRSMNGVGGEATIFANLASGGTLTADKKWGEITRTVITPPQDQVMVWTEATKSWSASANITDNVFGAYWLKNPVTHVYQTFEFPGFYPTYDASGNILPGHGAQEVLGGEGAKLNWYLLQDNPTTEAWVASHSGLMRPQDLLDGPPGNPTDGLNDHTTWASLFTTFSGGGTVSQTTSSATGSSAVTINATGEEPVLVVVVPAYPVTGELPVMLEWTKLNFWTSEMEVVPQVRWAGEKIVLEKFFSTSWSGRIVRFSKEAQGPGNLEGIGTGVNNTTNTSTTVWTTIGTDGYARCMLVSQDPGEVAVDLAVYYPNGADLGTPIFNQHAFTVYYLALEDITLHNVVGKRDGHNTGLWTTANPWNPALDWEVLHPGTPEVLNVSSDTLLRSQVRGWFLTNNASNQSARPERVIDTDPTVETGDFNGVKDNDPTNDQDMVLPAHRWILPDDWARLAGADAAENRIHWDIMDNPFDTVGDPTAADLGLGAYVKPYTTGPTVAASPVVGPFRPGLEIPTATGYAPNIPVYAIPQQKSVVPNGVIESWDAPMPPAKITFKIMDVSVTTANPAIGKTVTGGVGDAGFFKDAMKTDIYYVMVGSTKVYTNPFYFEMIAAFSQIPAFVNNGGYDWDSWNTTQYGPYPFWKIINRLPNESLPTTTRSGVRRDNANFPAKVQVYSDNHGESMVWLNGNYNLNPDLFTFKGLDILFGSTVGSTSVIAMADYPYFRNGTKLVSFPVTKTWTWGGEVIGATNSADRMVLTVGDFTLANGSTTDGTSNDKMVWVWATDRDGMQAGVLNTQIDWSIGPRLPGGLNSKIQDVSVAGDGVNGVSTFNSTMKSIGLSHGFLNGTGGMLTGSMDGTQATSFMRAPTAAEQALFNKFWGAGGTHPMLGADGLPLNPLNFVVAAIDLLDTTQTADVSVTEVLKSPDFGTLAYFTNVNFASSYPLDDNIVPGDANLDGVVNMADVTAIERIILGVAHADVQADANSNDKIDMGDVVRTERIILQLP
jgi:hypothetical protein